jgi:hypothetical protein
MDVQGSGYARDELIRTRFMIVIWASPHLHSGPAVLRRYDVTHSD